MATVCAMAALVRGRELQRRIRLGLPRHRSCAVSFAIFVRRRGRHLGELRFLYHETSSTLRKLILPRFALIRHAIQERNFEVLIVRQVPSIETGRRLNKFL